MNIQAMMKQAQKLQKDMMDVKDEINKTTFEGKSAFVTVTMNGNKELTSVKFDVEKIEKDEIETVQDMIVVAINDAMKKIDFETDKKMGKFQMPGMF